MDLAEGHILALNALDDDATFATPQEQKGSGFGSSGGKYKAYNLGKGKGMSVMQCVDVVIRLFILDQWLMKDGF